MEEESEQCARLCGNCVHFSVLDDQPGDPCKWFGVCDKRMSRDFRGKKQDVAEVLVWVYGHGKRGDDDCDGPDEWYEEG